MVTKPLCLVLLLAEGAVELDGVGVAAAAAAAAAVVVVVVVPSTAPTGAAADRKTAGALDPPEETKRPF